MSFFSGQNNGLKHVSQWDEKLSGILKLYQEKQEELSNMQTKHPKAKAGKVNVDIVKKMCYLILFVLPPPQVGQYCIECFFIL